MVVDNADVEARITILGVSIQSLFDRLREMRAYRDSLIKIHQVKNEDGSDRTIIDDDTGDPIKSTRRQTIYDAVKTKMDIALQ